MIERTVHLPDGVPPLNMFYAYLTGGCNLACQHCWISPAFQKHGGTGGHLDYDLFSIAVEEGLALGLNNVKLTGGEPLLHPDFIRFVDLISAKKLRLTIETNGTLITEDVAQYLKKNSTLSNISVSLDGATAATHDPFRGVKGSFKEAVQGIRYLVMAGFRPQIIMSIHVDNVNEIEALARLAESLGAGSVKYNLIQESGRGALMAERGHTLDIHRLIEIGNWVEGDLQNQTSIPLHYSWPIAFHSLHRILNVGSGGCSIMNILGILSTGHIAMCGIGVQVPDLCYGKLGEDHIEAVWTSNTALIDMRAKLPYSLEGICSRCLMRTQCLGSCVAQNYNIDKSLTAPFWFCAQAEANDLFPNSRLT